MYESTTISRTKFKINSRKFQALSTKKSTIVTKRFICSEELDIINQRLTTPWVQPKIGIQAIINQNRRVLSYNIKIFIYATPNGRFNMVLAMSPIFTPFAFSSRVQSSWKFNTSQQNLRSKASFKMIKDLRPKPLWDKGLQTLFQTIVTTIYLSISLDKMKFLMLLSRFLMLLSRIHWEVVDQHKMNGIFHQLNPSCIV